ncbi:MAG: PAS domain S-box protein [Gemmatimonadota bacterium]
MPSAEHYREVFRAAPDGILLVDAAGTIVEANPEALRLFGYAESQLVGAPIETLVPAAARDKHRERRDGYLAHPRPRPMGIGMELAGVRNDGVLIPVEISLSPLVSTGGTRVVVIVRDLTEHRRLKGFGAAALKAQEAERQRIAHELHDETAQSLAALLLRMKVLEMSLSEPKEIAKVAELREGLNAAMEGVRRMARGLRPPDLEEIGLAAALRSDVRARFPHVRVVLQLDGSEKRLSPDQTLAAYRIAQEAITNAIRHGGAETVEVRVRETESGESAELEISDTGRGFDPKQVAESGTGLGLVGMDERAQIAGGRFELSSHPGKGTRVKVLLPIAMRRRDG